jgi:Protein of unknown function, DUF547.
MARRILQGVVVFLFTLTVYVLPGHFSFAEEFDHSHSVYDSLLKKYVHNAKVDYKGFIDSEEFNTYLNQLGSASESEYENWSRDEKLAFWINAYNAFTIKAIVDHYPIDRGSGVTSFFYPKNSIRQIDGVWDKLQFRAAGRMVTLNEIEHEILRKQFEEPRIHAAINCASTSCPDLRSEAYKASKINEQLENQAIEFVNNPEKGAKINITGGTVKVSKILDWFGGDFVSKYGDTGLFKGRSKEERAVLNFVRTYLQSDKEKEFLESNEFDFSYLDYDWGLNELKDTTS